MSEDQMRNDETQPDGVQPTAADAVTDPTMVPFDDDAGGPTADQGDAVEQDEQDEPGAEEAAAQLGDFA